MVSNPPSTVFGMAGASIGKAEAEVQSTLVETIQKPLTENEQQIRYQGKYNEAETMNQQALAGYERALGPEHPDMSTGMDNHSRVFETMSRRIRRRWTLAGYETVLERGYPDTPTSVSNLAGGLQAEGQYNEAELMNQQAPAEYERALGSESPDTPMGMDNLSGVLQDQSMSYEGRSLFDELKRPRVTADGSRLCEGCDLPLHPEAADLPPSSLWPPGMLRFQPLLLRVSAERGCKVCAFIQKELVQRVAGFSFNDPEWDYSKRGGFVSAQNFQGMIDGKLSSATFEIFADVSSSSKITPIPQIYNKLTLQMLVVFGKQGSHPGTHPLPPVLRKLNIGLTSAPKTISDVCQKWIHHFLLGLFI